jgi:ribosomal protein S18 acetylase RimI-like enzyme
MTTLYRSPRRLRSSDELGNFECQSVEQTEWLRRHARQSDSMGTTAVLVSTTAGDGTVAAYYAWSMASIGLVDAPDRLRKGAGRYPQPVAVLARLGVSIAHEGRGLGAGLLRDVITRAAELGTDIGCRGLLVHAETEAARDFYLHLIPEFESSPTDELHLVLLMKDIRRFLRDA